MDTLDHNGGNAEVARGDSNLENLLVSDKPSDKQCSEQESKSVDEQELNGEVKSSPGKKLASPSAKRKLQRRSKTISADSPIKSPKQNSPSKVVRRKIFNDGDMSSCDSEDFIGFDAHQQRINDSHSIILEKLLGGPEPISIPTTSISPPKRRKVITMPATINMKNADSLIDEADYNSTDSEDQKMVIESDPFNVTTDGSSLKSEKSANSSVSVSSVRSRKSRTPRGASPGNAVRQKSSVDVTNPIFREPFKYGWKRELVYRATGQTEHSLKRMADIYYYTPEGKKVRSYREVVEFLTTSELTIDNFTFFKEPLGVNDPEKEIIRDAKKGKDMYLNRSTVKTVKKILETPPMKKASPKRPDKATPSTSNKVSPKATKTPSTFKVKLPNKKATPKKEIKSPPIPTVPKEMPSTSQWNLPAPRRNQNVIEKNVSLKPVKSSNRKQLQPEIDHRQNFMASICAGYNALTKIFQYLKVQELLRAARVSRMWRDLAAHPSLWKTVRMKNSQVTDWDGLADTLRKRGTQHLDLRKMLIVGDADTVWKKFIEIIPKVSSLTKLELCRCPAYVVEDVMKSCPQLQVFSALTIKCDSLNLEPVTNLSNCTELRLKAISGMSLQGDLSPLTDLMNITHLSLTSVKDLGRKRIDIIQSLQNLDTLELGECSDFPDKFGTTILIKLQNLERLRLEKGQGSCCTFDILNGISQLNKLTQLELVNFDVKNGFDDCLANCKNIKRLLIIPTYVSQSATSNNMILGGVTELSNNLTHFVWGVTQELLRVTELFIDQCKQMGKQISGDSIPVLKPVPCLHLIEDMVNDRNNPKDENAQSNVSNPQVEILPLPHLQKLLLTALPKTRVKILKIPFHATWRQSISDSAS
ncbi:hypothetical protein QAD02_022970 [Eretmocerus hayati]|uniref:Uncharacterized protein n=1 Tax=Eretmocerus hayati TaxID=131215 RepID=A0ACC2PWM8_9HYME|nr:hypothetical protein QAD02_022970 [Eretmocerus hayati]